MLLFRVAHLAFGGAVVAMVAIFEFSICLPCVVIVVQADYGCNFAAWGWSLRSWGFLDIDEFNTFSCDDCWSSWGEKSSHTCCGLCHVT